MNKRFKSVIIFFSLLAAGTQAGAQINLWGTVEDSLGLPLDYANIIAINSQTNALESFAISSEGGRYKIKLKKNAKYKIQLSFVGMKTFEELLTTGEANIKRNYTLKSKNVLEQVEIISVMPVIITGDIMVYDAESFTSGTEKKLEDVLKKLPGVEINDEGQVEVEGKKVSKIMVEGKDFFDGDSKLAIKNIPADAVAKVEVLKNFSEVGQLRGVTNNYDNIAMNIKLKKGKKKFWFGDVTAGAGTSPEKTLFLAQPKLFYYSPAYSINYIGDLNNIGEIAFTRRDYFNFSGGFRNFNSGSGTSINLGDTNMGMLTLRNNKAKSIDTEFSALNFSYSPGETLDFSGFVIYSGAKTDLLENTDVIYTDKKLNIPDEFTESATNQANSLALIKLSGKYKPNSNNQLDYDVFAKLSDESENQNFNSSVIGDILQKKQQQSYSIKQNLNYYYTYRDNHVFAFQAQHLLQNEDPFYEAIMEAQNDIFDETGMALGFDGNQNLYDISQNKMVKSNKLDARLDYWNVLNKTSNIQFSAGNIFVTQNFDSQILQILDNGIQFNPVPAEGSNINAIDYTFNDLFAAFHYNLKLGIFTFTPGFSTHAFYTKNNQFEQEQVDNFGRILPDFKTVIQLKRSENIQIDYNVRVNFTDVTNLAEAYVLNNYNSIFSGVSTLGNSLSHNARLSYFNFNLFNYTNIFAFLNYNKRIDAIRNQANFESVIRTSSPFNSNLADESISANGRYDRRFGYFRASVSGNFSWSTFNQFINNRESKNKSFSQNYKTRFSSNFKKAPNFELGYSISISDNNQGGRTSRYITHKPYLKLDAVFLKSFLFKAKYSYNNFGTEDSSINTYTFFDASLEYHKEDSNWEYRVSATNILDTKSLSQTNISPVSVSASEYFIQPRFIVFSINYKL